MEGKKGLYQYKNHHHFFARLHRTVCWSSDPYRNGIDWRKWQGTVTDGSPLKPLAKDHSLVLPEEYLT